MTKGLLVLLLACAAAAYADNWKFGDVTMYTQGAWGGDPSVDPGAARLVASYDTVIAPTFGIVAVGSTSGFTMRFSDAGSVLGYMPSIGPFKPLNGNVLNQISTASGGFGGEVLGLEFNVDFSDAGFLSGASGLQFGDLILENFSAKPVFDVLTIRQFLGDVNTLLAGGSSIFTIADLGSTVGELNASFSEGTPSAFAQNHLVAPASGSTVPKPSSRLLLIVAALALGCTRRLRRDERQEVFMLHSRMCLTLALTVAFAGAANATTWQNGDLTTYSQSSWGGDPTMDAGAALLDASYDTVYAGTFGLATVGSTSGFTMTFTDAPSVRGYMPSIGPFKPLNGSVLNPISTASGGLGGEVLGLKFNVDFSDAGFLPGASGIPFGNLVLANVSTLPVLNGLTVRQFLGDVNILLGGGSTIFTIADLDTTIGELNGSFFDGTPNTFAQDHLVAPASVSTVPEPSSRMLLIIAALALGCTRRLRRRNSVGWTSCKFTHWNSVMSFGAIGLVVLAAGLALPTPAAADPIASAFTSVSVPALCGSVCTPPVSQSNSGGISGGILSSIASLDQVEFAEARINLATGAAGVAVANDRGFSRADASHSDTWLCTDPLLCGALATPGSFVPVTIHLHVSGSASLTPGAMNLSYFYNTNSLLGSSALGTFQFNFAEDGARDPNGNIGGQATFFDYHTGVQHDLTVDIVSQGFDSGMVAFGADLSVVSYIGGCAVAGCDLSKGIFTDVQSLNAQIDPGNDGSAQKLDSFNTFQVSFTSDLPFVSADGRTASGVVATPEPGSLGLVLAAAIAMLAGRARYRRSFRVPR